MAGFVECLDNDEAEEGTETENGASPASCLLALKCVWLFALTKPSKILDLDPQKKVSRIRHETQVHILNLLITSLELKTPNLALYLLGYDVKKRVSSTNLQDPGEDVDIESSFMTSSKQLNPNNCAM